MPTEEERFDTLPIGDAEVPDNEMRKAISHIQAYFGDHNNAAKRFLAVQAAETLLGYSPSYQTEQVITIADQGHADGVDWMVIDTPKGKVVWHQYWVGPGLATEDEVSYDDPAMTDEDAYDYAMGTLGLPNAWNDDRTIIREPAAHIGPVYRV